MSKNNTKSLQNQAVSAILGCFRPGIDKHSLKTPTGKLEDTYHVFSYAQRKALRDLANQAFRYVKAQHPDIRLIKDVTVDNINEFLESKVSSCSTETLKQYASKFRKMARCINRVYRVSVNWDEGLVVPKSLITPNGERQRTQQMAKDDYKAIMDRANASRSKATVAFQLTARFGLRVEGNAKIKAKNVHLDRAGKWGFGQVSIREKGGKLIIMAF